MRGLDENGNNVDKAQVSGRIYVPEITQADLARAESYVGLTVEYGEITYYTYKLLDKSISGYLEDDNVASVGAHAFFKCNSLTGVKLQAATSIGDKAFNVCSNLESVNLPAATKIGQSAFEEDTHLTKADLGAATLLVANAFKNCYSLTALILRSETRASAESGVLSGCYHFDGTTSSTYNPTGAKDGYIYVPAALVDSYKASWTTYASQFRAIEDYPEICGGEE
jgi:hypothetical protein